MAEMTVQELEAIVSGLRGQALGSPASDLSLDRQDALDYYFGRPFGNEIEGRSQIVERVVMEAVEQAKPQILRVFASTDQIAVFNPRGPTDEDQAQQETDYTNFVIMQKNPGFIILHDAITDALLLRNGYVKRYWRKGKCTRITNYSGLDENEVAKLLADTQASGVKYKILGKAKRTETVDDGISPPVETTVYDLKLRTTYDKAGVSIEAVPNEEVRVSPRCRGSLQQTDYMDHSPPTTRSDLLEMGMDATFVANAPMRGQAWTPEARARDPLPNSGSNTYDPNEPAQDEVDYVEAYARVDFDGDGIVELRRIVTVGGIIPPGPQWNEEVEEVPFDYAVPVRMPHRHTGLSVYDLCGDTQKTKSTAIRQVFDNVYLTNNQRPIINERVNQDDVLVSVPGAPIRVEGKEPVEGALEYMQPTPILGQAMPILDYLDNQSERRTGIGKSNTIVDPDVLRDTANDSIRAALSVANQRIELMIRVIAETLIKDLVRGVHGLIIRHQDRPETVRLRGQWVDVDPRNWGERDDLSVTVGLGMGTTDENRANMSVAAGLLDKLSDQGLVLPGNAYKFGLDSLKLLNIKNGDKYLTDPASQEGQQAAQQKQQAMQAQQQLPLQIEHIKAAAKAQQDQAKAQLTQQQSVLDHQLATQQITAEQHAEAVKVLLEKRAEAEKMQLDHGNTEAEILLNALVKIVSAALMGKAQPQQISGDVAAARGALNGVA